MAFRKGLALRFLQWTIRSVQFGCAAVVLGIFSYFLATLHNHNLNINNNIRAVEGISGAAVLYTLISLILLCCVAGFPITSFIAIVLDIAFAGAFIYVAVENRYGAGSCDGYVDTPYGRGRAEADVRADTAGFTSLPSFRTACRMQTACLAVSIIAIIFFLLSAVVEVFLVRHRKKEKRFGPGPNNNYTSGSGKTGLFGWRRRRKENPALANDSQLPAHTHPDQVRQSYNTEATAVGTHDAGIYNKYGESGYGHTNGAGAGVGTATATGADTGTGHGDGYTNDPPGYTNTTGYTNTAKGTHGQVAQGDTTVPQQGYQSYRYEDGVYDRA
ncbi:hypothetical protein SODALDRAFT_375384 [Sodiomyces alkalinus F11]|uniref:MARVEL domain-containing protein n=1 Tax=Sodiomyces alkalinus (strain CBS 110278 / VKM F-3762 / F11) TaxID=1314773 RepID=A0A3N2Q8X3_SODAK|nr:hypothetical protein SODALDRAFT_375384 [Sodiomyces alkalinus F11]ROT43176.1 hypothetical protein SODALDRAFT_375384 [Sodiomyces alkalinus F11]